MPEAKSVNNRGKNFVFLLILIAVIYLVITNLDVTGNLLLVALGFGAVIMIHEFGHFITAKMAGINVQAFSIGFSPVLAGILRTEKGWRIRILPQFFQKDGEEDGDGTLAFTVGKPQKKGETEYRIGLIPFGGFVKMVGQEDVGSVEATTDPRSFANKSLLIRIAVVAAGVIFNALSAIVIFMIAFMIGVRLPAPIVGGVMPNSPAAAAGIKAGDRVLAVEGKTDIDFTNIALAAALSDVNEKVSLKIQHLDGSIADVELEAAKLRGSTPQMPRSFGIIQAKSPVIEKVKDPNAAFQKIGLQSGDTLIAVNGTSITGLWDIEKIFKHTRTDSIKITISRNDIDGTSLQKTITVPLEPAIGLSEASNVASMVPRLQITGAPDVGAIERLLTKLGIAKPQNRLEVNDIIVSVGDVNYPTFAELRKVVTQYAEKDLPIRVLRFGKNQSQEIVSLTVFPKKDKEANDVAIGIGLAPDTDHAFVAKTIACPEMLVPVAIPENSQITDIDGKKVSNWRDILKILWQNTGKELVIAYTTQIGENGKATLKVPADANIIGEGSDFAVPLPFKDLRQIYKAKSPLDAVAMGYDRTTMFIAQTYVTLKGLFVGLISPKALMGPAGILKISYKIVEERMWTFYLYFMGLISASIAVMNFLPFPVLDGGVITLMLIEKIKGSPISERIQSAIAYSGLVLIMAFFLYVTWNDLTGVLFK